MHPFSQHTSYAESYGSTIYIYMCVYAYIHIYIYVCVCASKKLAMRQHRIEQSSLQDVYCSPIHMCVCQQEASQKQAPMLTRSRWHPISTHLCVCRLARRSPSQSPSHHQPHTSLPLAPHPGPPLSLSLSPQLPLTPSPPLTLLPSQFLPSPPPPAPPQTLFTMDTLIMGGGPGQL